MKGLLKCEVSKGMFPDEYAVVFSTGQSLFCDKSKIQFIEGQAYLPVLAFTERENDYWIRLHTPLIMEGYFISIPKWSGEFE